MGGQEIDSRECVDCRDSEINSLYQCSYNGTIYVNIHRLLLIYAINICVDYHDSEMVHISVHNNNYYHVSAQPMELFNVNINLYNNIKGL